MILSLHIKNIALIQELTIELGKGLNILSGETGAGKSIIIDSLNFVLGDRADRSLIRHGEKAARVEVVFDNKNGNADSLFDQYGIEKDDVIIITRMMTEDKSECRINGRIVNLSALRAVVGLLVDIHSQNEHQSLMKAATQMSLLDNFSPQSAQIKKNYQKFLKDYYEIMHKLEQYSTIEERNRTIDLLRFQIEEIEKALPSENEEADLANERNRYYNFQKIFNSLTNANDALKGNRTEGVINALTSCICELNSILKYDDGLNVLLERLESVKIEAEDIADAIQDKLDSEGIETMNIDAIEKRLEEIRLIKKKYGKSVGEIEEYLDKAKEKLDMLENAEIAVEKLSKQLNTTSKELITYAKQLHNERESSSKAFCNSIVEHLSDLGMKNTVFEIDLNFPDSDEEILNNLTQNGADTVEYLLSPNLGEPVKPLSKIASGGEMSRFMLALKNVIADIDDIDTLVFDEIDTGISGKIAKEVAKKLYNIARSRQVIAITHLPQLAAMADSHYLITKRVVDDKTNTFLSLLDEQKTYREIMRLAGSSENSQIGLSHAKELKDWAYQYKCSK